MVLMQKRTTDHMRTLNRKHGHYTLNNHYWRNVRNTDKLNYYWVGIHKWFDSMGGF